MSTKFKLKGRETISFEEWGENHCEIYIRKNNSFLPCTMYLTSRRLAICVHSSWKRNFIKEIHVLSDATPAKNIIFQIPYSEVSRIRFTEPSSYLKKGLLGRKTIRNTCGFLSFDSEKFISIPFSEGFDVRIIDDEKYKKFLYWIGESEQTMTDTENLNYFINQGFDEETAYKRMREEQKAITDHKTSGAGKINSISQSEIKFEERAIWSSEEKHHAVALWMAQWRKRAEDIGLDSNETTFKVISLMVDNDINPNEIDMKKCRLMADIYYPQIGSDYRLNP